MLSEIQAEFLKNARGDAFIRFFDPAYVRADIIVLERQSKTLYAVLHEQAHYIGNLDDDMIEVFAKNDEILLTGMLAGQKALNLKAPLSVTD